MKTIQRIPTIKEFLGNLELGFDFLQTAGEQLCKMKAGDFGVFDRILDQCDWLTLPMLETLILIGRKEIHPRVMLLPRHVYSRVVGLPYDEQLRAVSEPVAVPEDGSNGRDSVGKPAKDLTRAEAARVWSHPGIGRRPIYEPPGPAMELSILEKDVALALAAPTNRKPQVVLLDENGVAVVQFRRRISKA